MTTKQHLAWVEERADQIFDHCDEGFKDLGRGVFLADLRTYKDHPRQRAMRNHIGYTTANRVPKPWPSELEKYLKAYSPPNEIVVVVVSAGLTSAFLFTNHNPTRSFAESKAKEVVNQLLEGPGTGPDWRMSKAGNKRIDQFADKMAAAAAADRVGHVSDRVLGGDKGAPFKIDADFVSDDGADTAKRLAQAFNLRFVRRGPNGNPQVVGNLKTKRDASAFARQYGSKAVFEPAASGRGTDVFFE